MKLTFELGEQVPNPTEDKTVGMRNALTGQVQYQLLPEEYIRDAQRLFRRLVAVDGVPLPHPQWAMYQEPVRNNKVGADALLRPLRVGDYVTHNMTKTSRASILHITALTPRQFRYQVVMVHGGGWYPADLKHQQAAVKLDVEEEYRFPDEITPLV